MNKHPWYTRTVAGRLRRHVFHLLLVLFVAGLAVPSARIANAQAVSPIDAKYQQDRSVLGAPITDERSMPNGNRYRYYQWGIIEWKPSVGATTIWGGIYTKWRALNRPGYLGWALTDALTMPDGRARYNRFQGGIIFWTPQTGAHELHGAIYQRWQDLGWPRQSALGYPTSDETVGNGSRYNTFEHGTIRWTPAGGAHVVWGPPCSGFCGDNVGVPAGADIYNYYAYQIDNAVTFTWTGAHSFDFYQVRWAAAGDDDVQWQVSGGEHGSVTISNVRLETDYKLIVEGCNSGFFGSSCTGWYETHIRTH